MISIVPNFTKADIARMMADRKERIRRALISRLQFIGETAIANARNNGTYTDRTGNLRSSKGYVILDNGKQIKSSFPGEKNEGRAAAKEVIKEVKGRLGSGFALIVVAGMEYAAAVESKGYDVLTSSSEIAADDLKKAMKALTKKIQEMK